MVIDMKINLIEANQDLGVKVDGANLGPHVLTEHFKNLDIKVVNKPNIEKERDRKNRKKNLDGVNKFDEDLYKVIDNIKENNEFPLTIGGDHTIAIATSLASIKNEESLGIIWIDAHGDYNTFETTITGNLHGLPLAAVNGQCPLLTEFHHGNFFKHTNTVIVGGRDIDDWEMPNLIKDNIKVFTTHDIHRYGVKHIMDEAFRIASQGTNGVHISYDLDVIDPLLAPGVSVPAIAGISLDEAYQITDEIIEHKDLVKSMDLVEYNPTRDIDDKTKDIAINILEKVIKELS